MATITVPSQVRSGTVTSPDVAWNAGQKDATLTLVMPVQADRDNPANTIELRVEFSKDNGVTWKAYTMAGWKGGTGHVSGGVTNPPPSVSTNGLKGDGRVRLGVTLSNPMTLGATVVTT